MFNCMINIVKNVYYEMWRYHAVSQMVQDKIKMSTTPCRIFFLKTFPRKTNIIEMQLRITSHICNKIVPIYVSRYPVNNCFLILAILL